MAAADKTVLGKFTANASVGHGRQGVATDQYSRKINLIFCMIDVDSFAHEVLECFWIQANYLGKKTG